jgi:hypothetical protein
VPVCRYYATTGKCYYGDQCNFAHVKSPETTSAPGLNLLSSPTSNVVNDGGNFTLRLKTVTVATLGSTLYIGSKPNKSQIPCKHLATHGYCKYFGKGCEYNHDQIPVG